MALKAGRVGVAPDQVDEFGNINSEATSGYTKQEADAKFETQTHAASTYETKSDATTALAEKQPIRLSLPIELLSGSALTVEDALNGLNAQSKPQTAVITSEKTLDENRLRKVGNIVFASLRFTSLTTENAYELIGTIPAEYRPSLTSFRLIAFNSGTDKIVSLAIYANGDIKLADIVSNATITVDSYWFT